MQQLITLIMATNGQSRNEDDRWTKHHRNTFFLAELIVRNEIMVNEIIAWLFKQIMLTLVKIAGEFWFGWIRKVCKIRWCLRGIWAEDYQSTQGHSLGSCDIFVDCYLDGQALCLCLSLVIDLMLWYFGFLSLKTLKPFLTEFLKETWSGNWPWQWWIDMLN